MKIESGHYEKLKKLVSATATKERLAEHRAALVEYGKCQDVEMRIRWDAFYCIPHEHRRLLCQELYNYLDDDHIDTALKKIIKEIEAGA